MAAKRNRFEGIARGEPLRGSRAVARHVWNDETKWRSAFRLPRDEFGLAVVCGELLGYAGWIDFPLATGAAAAGKRQRRVMESA
jgi:hypothetical protein